MAKRTCQHDPLAARCTLQIQSSIFGEKRVICLICSKVNQLGRKTGKFDPMGAFQGVPAASASVTTEPK